MEVSLTGVIYLYGCWELAILSVLARMPEVSCLLVDVEVIIIVIIYFDNVPFSTLS